MIKKDFPERVFVTWGGVVQQQARQKDPNYGSTKVQSSIVYELGE